MNCLDIRSLATEYLEAALPTEDHAAFDQHIDSCEKCSEWLDTLRQAIEELGEFSTEELSTLTEKILLTQFRRGMRKRSNSDSEAE
jgi:predicted anti-sigma-YlaC factor YlaD